MQTSKDGKIYLINRATGSMGTYNPTCNPPSPSCNHIVQEIDGQIRGEVLSSPTYFNNTVYFQGIGDAIKAFRLANGVFAPTTPVAQSVNPTGQLGTLSISYDATATNTTLTGTVWAVEKDNHNYAVLHAYAPDTLRELYNSAAQGLRDSAGQTPVDFAFPTVAAGKVFVGTSNRLLVFGGGFFGWAGESPMGGSAKQIAVAQNKDGRLEVFYVGTDNAIYYNSQTTTTNPNTWSGQSALGGSAQQIATAQNQDGRLEVFYVGTNDVVYRNYQTAPNNGWSGELLLAGGRFPLPSHAKQITVGQNQDGRLEAFFIGLGACLGIGFS